MCSQETITAISDIVSREIKPLREDVKRLEGRFDRLDESIWGDREEAVREGREPAGMFGMISKNTAFRESQQKREKLLLGIVTSIVGLVLGSLITAIAMGWLGIAKADTNHYYALMPVDTWEDIDHTEWALPRYNPTGDSVLVKPLPGYSPGIPSGSDSLTFDEARVVGNSWDPEE